MQLKQLLFSYRKSTRQAARRLNTARSTVPKIPPTRLKFKIYRYCPTMLADIILNMGER